MKFQRIKKHFRPDLQQLSLFQMRDKYFNDILNIRDLSLLELEKLVRTKDRILNKTKTLPAELKESFDEVRLEPADTIARKALAEKMWEKKAFTLSEELLEYEQKAPSDQFWKKIILFLSSTPDNKKNSPSALKLRQFMRKALQERPKEQTAESNNTTHDRYNRPHLRLEESLQGLHEPNMQNNKTDAHSEHSSLATSPPAQSLDILSGNISRIRKLHSLAGSVVLISPSGIQPCPDTATGTGYLLSNRLLITHFDLLPDEETAQNVSVWMNYEDDISGEPDTPCLVTLRPDHLYFGSNEFGFSLIAIETLHEIPHFDAPDKIENVLPDQHLSVIHHARGEPKQVLHGNCFIKEINRDHFWFSGEPGLMMNGAPVLNNNLEIIGMCIGSCPPPSKDKALDDPHPYHHQALRYDRILSEIKNSAHRLKRSEQTFLKEEQSITGFLNLEEEDKEQSI